MSFKITVVGYAGKRFSTDAGAGVIVRYRQPTSGTILVQERQYYFDHPMSLKQATLAGIYKVLQSLKTRPGGARKMVVYLNNRVAWNMAKGDGRTDKFFTLQQGVIQLARHVHDVSFQLPNSRKNDFFRRALVLAKHGFNAHADSRNRPKIERS
jgi:hypothetical protein